MARAKLTTAKSKSKTTARAKSKSKTKPKPKTSRFKWLAGYEFIDCDVRTRNLLGFAAVKPAIDDPLEANDHGLFVFYPDERTLAKRWAYRGVFSSTGMKVAAAFAPEPKWVVVCDDGFVFSVGSGSEGEETAIAPRTYIANARGVGTHAYAVGTRRSVYRRDAPGKWTRLAAGLPADGPTFSGIDGFSEADLYACGDGELWHYNGKAWRAVRVPEELELDALVCGGDGTVYASANQRFVLACRGATCTKLLIGDSRAPEALAWYRDRLHVATGDELLELSPARGTFVPAAIGAPKLRYIGHLAARDGILLACGGKQAAYHDGATWRSIV